MKIALAQVNTTVGDVAKNSELVVQWTEQAADQGAEVVLFPELTLHGYPPRDLLEVPEFVAQGEAELTELAGRLRGGPAALVGFAEARDAEEGNRTYNSVAWLEDGAVLLVARKSLLPNYDVFDERRHIEPASERVSHEHAGLRFGLSICEDIWNDRSFWAMPRYDLDPLDDFVRQKVDWLFNISASPYGQGKPAMRRKMLGAVARERGLGIALCNLVGGNDSLIFDGNSMVVNARGELVAHAPAFEEALLVVDLDQPAPLEFGAATPRAEEVFAALVLGVRDYARKTGFRSAVVGLSGGIDSSLTAVVAARALGAANVLGVAMPSQFTSHISDEDAAALARNLGIDFEVIPIAAIVDTFEHSLSPLFKGRNRDVTEENIQARVRGVLLMGVSNKLGHLLLSTGNKSEMAVGYCTLYGDMAGGLAVIGDVEKTLVFEISRWLNREGEVIPARVLSRPPSAELRPDQRDDDSLPPYDVLDPILKGLVEDLAEPGDLRELGPPELVNSIRRMLIRAEYKRRQAAPTLKVSPRAFGEGWRFPIAHSFRPRED